MMTEFLGIKSARRAGTAFVGAIASTALVLGGIAPASATEAPDPVHLVEESLSNLDPNLLLDPSSESGLGKASLPGGDLQVTSGGTVEFLASAQSERLVVEMPVPDNASARVLEDGTVTYPSEEFSSSVIVGDNAVQMLTTINTPDAPSTYSYDVALNANQSLNLVEGGAAEILNADGSVATPITAPWAVDANGQKVATHYEIDGSTLIQVIDHTSSDVAYPVTADPFWLAPWIFRCLVGIGLNGAQIARIASMGTPWSIVSAFGYGALRCVLGR